MTRELKPHEVILVDSIPACDFCYDPPDPGPYDFKTKMGPWAHGCELHYHLYKAHRTLGTGRGQLWVTKDQV